ncbi:hypothetical protein [Actinomadura roseirufa]|uniref:hypothetical protein n=1 Tax=Actinomadura roseirufa TaxID=2094049 RepID=UPI001041B671|nr:hypothetical protein [Actinomadura roseirufa]
MSAKPPPVDAVEFDRRVQSAVWGLAVTLGLFGWTTAPWLERNGKPHPLWDSPALAGTDVFGTVLSLSTMLTLVLGVAASAAASRQVAIAAVVSGAVDAVLIVMLIEAPGDDFKAGYGARYGLLLVVAYVVVFACVAWAARRPPQNARTRQWMDRSFGTVDRRTHVN